MCGIAGWVDFKNNISDKRVIIENMTNKLIHRGPDEYGIFISDNVLFGHRRLIVIDPNGGKQPMIKKFGDYKYVIVYNGELYNADTLRNILKGKSHKFNSYSDTEVVLTSYIQWGEDCVKYFNGIFAFAILNESNKSLFMARDHLGVKPLFYFYKNNQMVFASEIKALFEHPDIEATIDEESICELFGLGPARSPGSAVFKDIKEIKPGHYAIYSKNKFYEKEYWDLTDNKHTENLEQTVENVREILIDSIKRQLVSDVPLCTFLSGGLDSSIISAVSAKEFKDTNRGVLNTYSIEYVDNDKYFKSNDFQPEQDAKWSARMVEHIGSNHHIIYVDTPQLLEALKDAVIANDLPGMADVDSSMLLLCKGVSENFTVALSGECADEVFGGYPWFWKEEFINCNTFPWSRAVDERKKILSQNFKNIKLEEYVDSKYKQTIKKVCKLEGETDKEHRMREIYYLNHKWFMQTLLNRKDRMSMASGLEARVPFSDRLLVEYAWNIPCDMKYYNKREKGLLRKAAEGILPTDVIERKKSPFPKTHNPSYTKSVQEYMNKVLEEKNSLLFQLLDRDKVKQINDTGGKAFVKPWYGQLMTGPQLLAYFIQVDMWLKQYNVKLV